MIAVWLKSYFNWCDEGNRESQHTEVQDYYGLNIEQVLEMVMNGTIETGFDCHP